MTHPCNSSPSAAMEMARYALDASSCKQTGIGLNILQATSRARCDASQTAPLRSESNMHNALVARRRGHHPGGQGLLLYNNLG